MEKWRNASARFRRGFAGRTGVTNVGNTPSTPPGTFLVVLTQCSIFVGAFLAGFSGYIRDSINKNYSISVEEIDDGEFAREAAALHRYRCNDEVECDIEASSRPTF